MSDDWRNYVRRIEELAAASGLKFLIKSSTRCTSAFFR